MTFNTGNGLALSGITAATLCRGDVLVLIYDATYALWYEVSRSYARGDDRLICRFTTAQRIALRVVPEGRVVFDTDLHVLMTYLSGVWGAT